ncbi:N-acetyltransferase family protein [Methanoregula sp.]|jgi:ribosomal protein S18 acetylase RimI-like enzyme|uniref:GNAT family N-acetyltransferase n=1 Tax=Methanoregula sp. TaxID=2052170 RepID=UPI003C1FA66E
MVYPTDPGNGIHTYVPGPDFLPQGTVACLPLTESDVDGTARLYNEVFLADEPTTHRRSPDPALFLHYAILYARSLAGKNLSFVARDDRTGEPVGFIFCVDMTDDPKREGEWMVELLAYFREVVTMIDELEDRYLGRAEIAPGSVLHIFQIGVSRQYREHGIAQALIRRVLAHARERGYRQVIADCTNPVSRRSFEQCGFHEAGSLSYEAFSMDGVRFFAGLEGGISLMVRDV